MALARGFLACALLTDVAALADPVYLNVTAGGPLRPGVYGRIDVRGEPPPVIYPHPTVANQALGPLRGEPVYWYLPPGQVRKWDTYCRQYAACDVPVYFLRMDNNPGKLGHWKKRTLPAKSGREAGARHSGKDGSV